METKKIITNLAVFGVVITLFFGIGYNHHHASMLIGKIKTIEEIKFQWFITFLMYSIVMTFLALYIAYNEVVKHKSKIKGPLSVGVLAFSIVNVISVLIGFSPIRFSIILTVSVVLGVALLFYMVNRYLLK